MKHSHFITSCSFLLLFFVHPVAAQNDWLQGWRNATVAIGVIDTSTVKDKKTGKYILKPNGDTSRVAYFRVVGTGVICANQNKLVKTPILLTAKHVFYSKDKNWDPALVQIRFSWFSDKSITEYFGIPISLKNSRGNNLWFSHPDESVDLATIPLVLTIEEAGRSSVAPISIDMFADTNEVFEGASVLLYGYPGSVGTEYWTKPVMRHGVIAYVNPLQFGKQPILIDAMIFPGNSGGPVFTVPSGMDRNGSFRVGGKSAFLGIVSKVARQSIDVEKVSSQLEYTVSDSSGSHFKSFEYMGLGIIEPAERVHELLEFIIK
jgi:V8-like Glu-specific endopeptidase